MATGILGRKLGMTQIFTEDGKLIPVTVVDVSNNIIMQQKTVEVDGYDATQVGFEDKREKVSTKPEIGHANKANTAPKRFVKEFRFSNGTENELAKLALGQSITEEMFQDGDVVDVTGTSKGKGFAGSIKRHNQSRGPMAHGSRYHRGPGSMGPIKGNMKGKNLPGHMGAEQVTVQNLPIIKVDQENHLLLIAGSVPGPKRGFVMVKTAVKKLV